jgi:hypothetical protein
MELLSCDRSHPARTVTGAPRKAEWPPLISERAHRRSGFVPSVKDFNYPRREERIFRCSIDRPGDDKRRLHNTSRQKYLPSLIEEE